MNRVANKVALITGAASGVGRADALLLAAEGARVVLTDIDEDAGRALAREIGDAALFVHQDIADEDGWRHAIASTLERFGRLDVLVNNAAICPAGSIEDTSLDTWRRVLRVNADGYFLGCKYAIGAMKHNDTPGSIVMMSSVAALGGLPMMCAYTGSKGAVTALARSVAVHCRRSGYRIRCNSIHPDGIWTPMTQALMPGLDPAELGIGNDPMARMCDPQDVANLVLFLASDESRFVNGAELRIDNAQLVSSL
ncbi:MULTISPECIES: SDR family oxidoreductase [unclassified Burkholderia]|uniref:SDR family oxidoreductase n=1 Tax=unclassified Burkholderia TaxID=2613784 RepID=UPI000F575DF9|nr:MULTISPECIES: SDR family oxidoreductase [unclassified Burkholderia]RQR32962.1 SDR family NAD(P)-dependent oxidoreductase [Burkholderia sp. Bp9142]RQR55798.1 SDR family NAD(P)-dependent oxidoreductase [Burkholderia sp. Bp9140]